jgi:hypothetical protein
VEDPDVSQGKMAESAQRVVDRAIEKSRRRDHALLTNEHVFLAFAVRFLKRVIDDTIKLPIISQHWKDGREFHVVARDGQIVVEPHGKVELDEAPVELAYGT